MGKAFKSLVFIARTVLGLLVIVVAGLVLDWNESALVEQRGVLNDVREHVVSIELEALKDATQPMLVHVQGDLISHRPVTDPLLNDPLPVVKLWRQVEMYQWTEELKRIGSRQRRRWETVYRRHWKGRVVDSDVFQEPKGHQNPKSMPYEPQQWTSSEVALGPIPLNPKLLQGYEDFQPIVQYFPNTPAPTLFADIAETAGKPVQAGEQWFALFSDSAPQLTVGDFRIRWQVISKPAVTMVAYFQEGTLKPYEGANGQPVFLVKTGTATVEEMLANLTDSADTANEDSIWFFRLIGAGAMVMGIAFVLPALAPLLRWDSMDHGNMFWELLGMSLTLGVAVSASIMGLKWLGVDLSVGMTMLGVALMALTLLLFGLTSIRKVEDDEFLDELGGDSSSVSQGSSPSGSDSNQ